MKTPSFRQIKAKLDHINIRKIKFGLGLPIPQQLSERNFGSWALEPPGQEFRGEYGGKQNELPSIAQNLSVKFLYRSGINLS